MGWRSIYYDNKAKKQKTGSISKEQLKIAEDVAPVFFAHREQSQEFEFYVEDMVRWVKVNYPTVAPFAKQIPRSQVRAANPGKTILDIQDLCYQLSGPESFWIEDGDTDRQLIPLERHGKNHYELKKRWRDAI